MFTGLIQAIGTVVAIKPTATGVRLEIDPGSWDQHPTLGESIAVGGCCLTLAEPEACRGAQRVLTFDVVPETLAKTTLGGWRHGSRVNLERSLRASDLIGGHFVQGHVEGAGRVVRIDQGPEWRVRISAPIGTAEAIIPKGSIAVDGVSLTVAACAGSSEPSPSNAWFEVALIPTTLRLTTLASLREGDPVNIETDMMARSVLHYLRHMTLERMASVVKPGVPGRST